MEEKKNSNLDLYNRFRAVPSEAVKPIDAGRLRGFTDINPMWRIKALTEAFGPCGIGWYYKTTNRWMEPASTGEVAAFVSIELFVKVNGEWSMPIEGVGGSKFVDSQSKGLYVSDEAYKMATTDAISVACKNLGVAADIYYAKDRTKYTVYEDSAPKKNDSNVKNEQEPIKNSIYDKRVSTISEIIKDSNLTISQAEMWAKKHYSTNIQGLTEEQFKELTEAMKGALNK